ncbi:MAG: hypothetical protein LUE27_06900 [Clostridia bacterium]|nr:hypothetical protein [Clostridia bacterium]
MKNAYMDYTFIGWKIAGIYGVGHNRKYAISISEDEGRKWWGWLLNANYSTSTGMYDANNSEHFASFEEAKAELMRMYPTAKVIKESI